MKKISFVVFALILLSLSCTKDIKQAADIFYEQRNVKIIPYFFYNGQNFRTDTVYETLGGGKFFQIDEIKIVLSNFYVVNQGDTLFTDSLLGSPQFAIADIKKGTFRAGFIPGGTYNGGYGIDLGVPYDTSLNANNPSPGMFRPEEALSDRDLFDPEWGIYDIISIKGRAYNPADTAAGIIPIHWRLRMPNQTEPARQFFRLKNFNLKNQTEIRFEAYINMESLLDQYDIYNFPNIGADLLDLTDQQRVKSLIDNFSFNLN